MDCELLKTYSVEEISAFKEMGKHFVPTQPHEAKSKGDLDFVEYAYSLVQKGNKINPGKLISLYEKSQFNKRMVGVVFRVYFNRKDIVTCYQKCSGSGQSFSEVFQQFLSRPELSFCKDSPFNFQLDFIVYPFREMNFNNEGMAKRGEAHFEPGIDGIMLLGDDEAELFLPVDAPLHGLSDSDGVFRVVKRKYGSKADKRKLFKFQTESYFFEKDDFQSLFRGRPSDLNAFLSSDDIQRFIKKRHSLSVYENMEARDYIATASLLIPYENLSKNVAEKIVKQVTEYCADRTNVNTSTDSSLKNIELDAMAVRLLVNLSEQVDIHNDILGRLLSNIQENLQAFFSFLFSNESINPEVPVGIGKIIYCLTPLFSYSKTDLELNWLRSIIHYLLISDADLDVDNQSWLLAALSELSANPSNRNNIYSKYIIDHVISILSDVYNKKDAVYPDYSGGIYKAYSDFPEIDSLKYMALMTVCRNNINDYLGLSHIFADLPNFLYEKSKQYWAVDHSVFNNKNLMRINKTLTAGQLPREEEVYLVMFYKIFFSL